MKKIYGIFISGLLLLFMSACEKDGVLYTLSGLESSELLATATDVALSLDKRDSVVVSFTWTTSTLTVSDTAVSVPDGVLSMTLQAATTSDFSTTIVESEEENLSKAFTGSELNILATTLGLPADTSSAIYFRMKSSIGDNIEPLYSNVVILNVTPYYVDFTVGKILNSSKEETGTTLYSADADGSYTGFMGATAWYNFYLQEGDGTIWGNDAVTGTAFELSSDDDHWNCWFPGVAGCYYVIVNTETERWSSLLMPSLAVSGDIQGDMTFDRATVRWLLTFEATSTSMTIQLGGTGNQYNYSTGTDDASAVSTAFGFTGTADALTFGSQAQNLTVTVPSTGTYTLTVDLSDPTAWTVEAVEGSQEQEEVNQYVYLAGIDDGRTNSDWNFDNTLTLYDEDNLSYAGVVDVNSKWGYGVYVEEDNWSDVYKLGTGDAYSGTLVYKGSTNLPAPTAGLYLIDVSLNGLTYALTSVGNTIYLAGLNNDWVFDTMPTLTETATAGVYTGQVTISTVSSWGFQIHLDTTWSHFFGGSGGSLTFKGGNITEDATIGIGTYTLTVDLIGGTYSFTSI